MIYKKFTIKSFKGIKKLELNLGLMEKYNIFTLVGLNESGKTTILEAIDFLQKDILESERHKLIPKDKKSNFNGNISVSADLELTNDDEIAIAAFAKSIGFNIEEPIKKISIEKIYTFSNSIYQNDEELYEISLVGKTKSGRKKRKLDDDDERWISIVDHIREYLLPPIIYYPNFLVDFPERIYLQAQEKESREQRFYRDVIQDILDYLNDNLTIGDHLIKRIEDDGNAANEALEHILSKMSEKITDVVLKSWGKIFERTSTRKQIIIKPKTEVDSSGVNQHYLEIKLKVGSESYHIQELSLGFKWFFAFLLFTEFRKHRSKDKGEILFLLDEPASNLHSTAQNKLKEMFDRIIKKSKLVYATHSHHLINSKWLEGVFIVRNKALDYEHINYDSSKTDIEAVPYRQFVSQHSSQETYFKPILDSLDYRPSDLELVPNIVIVEGKNDFYVFKYINEVILKRKSNLLNFYPGNGAGKNDKIIRLYIAWVRNFIVFMDSDSAGKSAKEKYLTEIGKIVEDKIFILSDVNRNWQNATTESLFTDTEKRRIIKTIYPDSQSLGKTKFNQAIQNLLFLKQSIVLSKRTTKKFEKIFTLLKNSFTNK